MKCRKCGFEGNEIFFVISNKSYGDTIGLCKKCKAITSKTYYRKNKVKINKLMGIKWRENPERRNRNKLYKELQRTGMNATEYVKNKKCEICGINNEDHFKKYNRRLNIHHVNNDGRHFIRLKLKPIHYKIQVLCQSCHVSIDNRLYKNYKNIGYKIWETRRKNANHSVIMENNNR